MIKRLFFLSYRLVWFIKITYHSKIHWLWDLHRSIFPIRIDLGTICCNWRFQRYSIDWLKFVLSKTLVNKPFIKPVTEGLLPGPERGRSSSKCRPQRTPVPRSIGGQKQQQRKNPKGREKILERAGPGGNKSGGPENTQHFTLGVNYCVWADPLGFEGPELCLHVTDRTVRWQESQNPKLNINLRWTYEPQIVEKLYNWSLSVPLWFESPLFSVLYTSMEVECSPSLPITFPLTTFVRSFEN